MIIDTRAALSEIIKEGAYNQAALAKKASLSPAQLSQILHKRRKMDSDEMFALCDALNIQPSQLADSKYARHTA